MKTLIAFLEDDHLLIPRGEHWETKALPPYRAGDSTYPRAFWETAQTIWILPKPYELTMTPADGWTMRPFGGLSEDGLAPVWTIAPASKPHDETFIITPPKLQAWGIDLTDADDLLNFLTHYYALTGVLPVWNPGAAGLDILRKLKKESGQLEQLKAPTGDLAPWARKPALDLQWVRPLLNSEREKTYLHAYDKNAAYLSAANIQLGVGDYEHLSDKDIGGAVTQVSGRWLAQISGDVSDFLPHATGENAKAKWLDTPTLKLALHCGLSVVIKEGFYFPTSARVFEKWYTKLKDAREWLAAHPQALPANVHSNLTRAIKKTYTRAIGLLSHKSKDFERSWKYRPDWRNMIVAEASARMYYNLETMRQSGFLPAAIYTDCVYYVSDDPDPTALPLLTHSRMGQSFKHKATYPLQPIKHLFNLKPYDFVVALSELEVTEDDEELSPDEDV